MARMSISILTTQSEEGLLFERVKSAATQARLAFNSVCDEYENLLKAVEGWAVLPEIVIFDIPKGKDVFSSLEDLGEAFPEGEVDLILTGVPNDIMTYRKLKRSGISEIFPENPSAEDLRIAIEEISTREIRATEIDPRRAVYVWAACGGAGATTIATGFARHLSKSGQRTLLIDMDIYSAPVSYSLSAKEGARETYGLVEALMTPQRVDSIFLERSIQKVDKNLYYLSSRKKPGDDGFDPAAVSVLISRAQRNFDVVVVDTPWRPQPEVDWGKVNGTSFIVATPGATGYLGFSSIAGEISSTPSKAPAYGVINKAGEFKSNDFTPKMFSEAFDGDIYSIPYDPTAAGKLFFGQKALSDVRGRVHKPYGRILRLLPTRASGGISPGREDLGSLSRIFGETTVGKGIFR